MDSCHCAEPAPERTPHGDLFCLNCRLYYDEAEWKVDSRVKRAQLEARRFTKEQEDIVNTIMKEANEQT